MSVSSATNRDSELPKDTAGEIAENLYNALITLMQTWDNDDKEPGWCNRLDAARSDAYAALERTERFFSSNRPPSPLNPE